MNEEKDITKLLEDLLKEKRMSKDKLASLTDIPKRFIVSLINGSFDQLPAKPYVRGYLFKIAEVLGVDQHSLWQSYRHSSDIHSSGNMDRLPENRFALKPVRTGVLMVVAVVFVGLAFLGFRFNDILGKPTLDIVLPESTSEEIITVAGSVKPGDKINLNGEVLFPDESGKFKKDVQLEPGLNTLEFQITRYLGRETKVFEQVFYQPATE